MKKYKFIGLCIVFIIINTSLFSSDHKFTFKINSNPNDTYYWWLKQNNFGINEGKYSFETIWTLKKINSFYVIDMLVNDNKDIYLKESFIKYNFSDKTFIRLGRYYRDYSLYLNDQLSSGHMLISKNAEPMPKIGLVSSYKIAKFDKIHFDFGISHAVLDKNQFYSKAPFLHEKFISMTIKKKDYQFIIGLVHEAMWAGTSKRLGRHSSSFEDFIKLFFSADGEKWTEDDTHVNALGSHLGIWDFAFQNKVNNKMVKIYYQHFIEDTSSLRFRNEIDGLWGLEIIDIKSNQKFLIEYLDTSNAFLDPPYQGDIYYANYEYDAGWRYKDYIIGNPHVNPHLYFDDSSLTWKGYEKTKVFHLATSGEIKSIHYELKGARKINVHDNLNYKLLIGKNFKDNINVNFFVLNNNKKNGVGMKISAFF